MTHIVADRVKEASSTTGTGPLTLGGAVTGFRAFSAVCSVGDTVHYAIEAVGSNYVPSGAWEVGLGTYSAANTLTRTTVLASSNAGAAVDFGAGTKHVWVDFPASEIEDFGALVALSTTGIAVRTAASTWATRVLASLSAALVVTNANGVSGNPTIDLVGTTLADYGIADAYTVTESDARFAPIAVPWASITGVDDDLTALAALSGTGIAVRTAADTWATRTIAGTTDRVTVTDGDGVAGNPTIDIAATYVGQASITNLGTITTGTWAASFPVAGGVLGTGEMGVRNAAVTDTSLIIGKPSSAGTTVYGQRIAFTGANTATNSVRGIYSSLASAASAYTVAEIAHFYAASTAKGAGSTITSSFGFIAANGIAVGSNNYGFWSSIAAATNTYQLYMGGTASNYIAGLVGLSVLPTDGVAVRLNVPSSFATAAQYGVYALGTGGTSATSLWGVVSAITSVAAAYTLTAIYHFAATGTTKGAGSTVSVVSGFRASNSMAIGTNNYGFYSDIAAAATTYQLYMVGTALNFLKGGLILDTTAAPTVGAGQIGFGATVQTTVGAAGAATALPAQPTGYMVINVAGTNRVVPYYAAA